MSVNFGFRRTLLLVVCIVGIWTFGGFDVGWIRHGVHARVWMVTAMLFLAGSVCVSVLDHETGHMEPRTNLRGAYIVLGILMIAGAAWFLYGTRSAGQ